MQPPAASNRKTKKASSGGGGGGGGLALLKRFSGGAKKHGKSRSGSSSNVADDDVAPTIDHDPVMAMFEARSTQRVRFSIEGVDGPDASKNGSSPTSDSPKASEEDKDKDNDNDNDSLGPSFNIKAFMSKTLFRNNGRADKTDSREEDDGDGDHDEHDQGDDAETEEVEKLVWENNELGVMAEVVQTTQLRTGDSKDPSSSTKQSFQEDPVTRKKVSKLLDKGKAAQFQHHRYEYAVNCHMKALELLTAAKYPDDHPLLAKTMRCLKSAHNAKSQFDNSANIVKMGIRYEENGELIRALKMYTIAYRIRRDHLSKTHSSLVVILNMLGSLQVKRGETQEAMQIYQLALKDAPVRKKNDSDKAVSPPPTNLLARAVTYREMGAVHERWGDDQKALQMYHRSLDTVYDWRQSLGRKPFYTDTRRAAHEDHSTQLCDIDNIQLTMSFPGDCVNHINNSSSSTTTTTKNTDNTVTTETDWSSRPVDTSVDSDDGCDGGMEAFINFPHQEMGIRGDASTTEYYNSFFAGVGTGRRSSKSSRSNSNMSSRDVYANVDVALTLHQIAQMHRRQGQYGRALDAYHASIRGMKFALGHYHPNVAAILGNIGNLQKETGDLDAAYDTYQEVLRLESYRLGYSHPEVATSLHNVATIEAARGNYEKALTIYHKVSALQHMLFGNTHPSLAVTLACMGDVHEHLGDLTKAIDCYERALKVKSNQVGRQHLEVGRMLHKLGKMTCAHEEYNMANSYTAKAILIYRMNRLEEDHEWIVEAHRDRADITAALALGRGQAFEC